MKEIVHNIFRILNDKERTALRRMVFFDILVSVLDLTFLAVLIYVIDFYTGGASTLLVGFPYDAFNAQPLLLIAVFFVGFCLKNWIAFRVFSLQQHFVYGVASRLSKQNILSYLQGDYNSYVNINSAVHSKKISQHPIEFGHYVLAGFQQVVGQSLLIGLTVIAILIYNPYLFPLLFIVLAPPIVLTGLLLKRKLSNIRATAKPVSEKTLQHLNESLSGYVESNIYGANDFFTGRYVGSQTRFNDFLASQLVVQHMPTRLIEVFAIFGLFVLVLINQTKGAAGIDLVTFGAFIAAAYKIIPGIVKILNNSGQMKTYRFTMDELLVIPKTDAKVSNESLNEIGFDKISFSYEDKLVLHECSFNIKKGSLIGIAGDSGRGKTTLINLLLGLEEQTNGNILFNDKIASAAERKSFWKNIAYSKQQGFLINDSLVTNITLSESPPEAERLQQALSLSGLDALIQNGMVDKLSEDGKNLSGGQRQRVSFARAIYKNADCIILDEPFSELDEISQRALVEHCKELALDKLVILITHHSESLNCCDKIIDLDAN